MLRTDDSPAPPLPSRWLVSTAWLADHLRDRNLSVVDASSVPPGKQGDAHADYRQGHIPGAVFFDINAISDHSTELPHMLPGPAQIGVAAGALGISETDTIVVYDSAGLYSAARVWWTFRIFGAKDVFILDGGLPKWKAEGRPLENGDAALPYIFLRGVGLGMSIFMVLAALSVTTEYRFGTIRNTFLATPRRPMVLAAKTVLLALIGERLHVAPGILNDRIVDRVR